MQARQEYVDESKARKSARTSPSRPISELEIGKRPTDALAQAGITLVGQFLDKLAEGEHAVLEISGFGRKSLIDLKKKLRSLDYQVPETDVA
ncbi:MAG TPA: DNA-directed RNA polymerase subunit alpha C-terminal domain-containing protein [Anaerolineales bacterium]|nr:DNA-directed RNA polymerase subunit alpha C-terminal domain-containing protein [Anaerolineales bacterium]